MKQGRYDLFGDVRPGYVGWFRLDVEVDRPAANDQFCDRAAMMHRDQVAVVLPLFNAERTIAATLDSILAQTHRLLDIIVVDDGSTDASVSIVREFQNRDPRIRCILQRNAGVAAARNAGAAQASAPFLAFCDADDLWAPRKIELQLDRMRDGGPSVALVYCWFARIDEADNVLSISRSASEGNILATLLRRNVIGNGSSPLFRKAAFDSIGGFSDQLTVAEDLAIYLAMAERYEIGVVPHILVGYRLSDRSLSANGADVYSCTSQVMKTYSARYPSMVDAIRLHLRGVLMWQIVTALRRHRLRTALRLFREDYGLLGTVFTVYIPELIADMRRGSVKDSWTGSFRFRGRRAFNTFAEANIASSPDAR
jgi:glycosyltransferase involved in cell wall biosynthesis